MNIHNGLTTGAWEFPTSPQQQQHRQYNTGTRADAVNSAALDWMHELNYLAVTCCYK